MTGDKRDFTQGNILKKLVFLGQGLSPGKRFRLKYGFLKIPQIMEKKSGQVQGGRR